MSKTFKISYNYNESVYTYEQLIREPVLYYSHNACFVYLHLSIRPNPAS